MSRELSYRSVLSDYMYQFVEMKEAAGHKIERAKWILKEIDSYALSVGLKEARITRDLFENWRKTKVYDRPNTLYVKHMVWNHLSCFMNRRGARCYVPQLPKYPNSNITPYIFTKEQISAIFSEIDKMRAGDESMNVGLFALPALFRFLYSTGTRISETLSLKNEDVKLDEHHVVLRNTKNDVERIVPICEGLEAVLRQYVSYRDKLPISGISEPSKSFFVRPNGTCMKRGSVLEWFKKAYMRCGIPYLGDHQGPRIHDLRHTFSVHSLEQMIRSGMDIYAALPILSCLLGHKSIVATERYVRLTKEMYPDIAEKCSELSLFVLPKFELKEE